MKFKAIFFDNDGILVDSEHLYAEAIGQVAKKIGYEGDTIELYKRCTMQNGQSVWAEIQQSVGHISEEEILALRIERNDIYKKLLQKENLAISGVKEVLQELHGKIPMAIVTSSRKGPFDVIHAQTGFVKYFDFVLTREDFYKSKPNPEAYLKAAQRMNIDPAECLVLEDSERGVISAKEAGMTCFAIPTDLTRNMDFSRADKVLGNMGEVIKELGIRNHEL